MQSDGTNSLTWNARNQVATINNVPLQYDASGRRTRNLSGTLFLYDGSNATQELSGTTVTANLLTGGIDELFNRTDSSGSFTPLQDALGSTLALVDSSGAIQTTYSYDPFGNTTVSGTPSANPAQYTRRENEGNGLYYYRNRYYSPVLHRFISEDPAKSGPNFYAYAGDDPIDRRDPFGLWDTYTHHALFWNALRACGVSKEDIWQIQEESDFVDMIGQFPDDAYMHSMRAPWQSPESALQERDDWIQGKLNTAIWQYQQYGDTSSVSNPTDTWTTPFADALHTLTDSTSPAHMKNGVPIVWPTIWPWGNNAFNAFQHGDAENSIETWKNMTPELEKQNIDLIRKAYERVTGHKCDCPNSN